MNLNKDLTEEFLSKLFPPREVIEGARTDTPYPTNDILQTTIMVYGKQASGKSELVRTLVEKAVERYGEENVNAVWSDGDLETLLYSLEDKLVNILFCEDLSWAKVSPKAIRDFFKVRHILQELTGRRIGLVIVILSCHRYHGIKVPDLRTDLDYFMAKNTPSNLSILIL